MKVDFGIYISDNSASIARMIDGQPTIIKTDTLKDKIALCVGFNKKGDLIVGDRAHNDLRASKARDENFEIESSANYYSDFLRTIGTNKTYYSSNTNQEYSSEQLVGFVIKTLKLFVKDDDIIASVITVPNNFNLNQIEAIRKSGILGGIEQVEIVQESIAASLTVSLDSVKYNNFSAIFSFQEKSFEVSLLKNGQIIEAEGNHFLSGENLDYTIVDNIIVPHIESNYEIDKLLSNENERQKLRHSLKFFAEETKIQLSFNQSHNILSDIGDLGEDDDGEELELDITVTDQQMTTCLSPVFQKAIDLTKKLLSRNNLEGTALDALILVGGPTFSPVLRKMLTEQICAPDPSAIQ